MENKWKPSKTIYQIVKEFINSKYYESDSDQKPVIITRQELLKSIEDTGEYKSYSNHWLRNYQNKNINKKYYSSATVDTIRNQLEKCGYLSKCYEPNTEQQKIIVGMYAIQKPIPDDLTGSKLRKQYNNSFNN